jgi:hypothetical protein
MRLRWYDAATALASLLLLSAVTLYIYHVFPFPV